MTYTWEDLVSRFKSLGFERDFIDAIEQECPSLDVLSAIISYAETRSKPGAHIAYLQKELDRAKRALVPLEIRASFEVENCRKLREEVAALKAENERLSTDSNARIDELQREIEQLREEIASNHNVQQNYCAKLSAENSFLVESLGKLRTGNEKLLSKVEMLHRDGEAATAELERLRPLVQHVQQLEHENATLRCSFSTINAENETLKKARLRLCHELENVRSPVGPPSCSGQHFQFIVPPASSIQSCPTSQTYNNINNNNSSLINSNTNHQHFIQIFPSPSSSSGLPQQFSSAQIMPSYQTPPPLPQFSTATTNFQNQQKN